LGFPLFVGLEPGAPVVLSPPGVVFTPAAPVPIEAVDPGRGAVVPPVTPPVAVPVEPAPNEVLPVEVLPVEVVPVEVVPVEAEPGVAGPEAAPVEAVPPGVPAAP
jgi:hypothetical protein